MAKQEAAEHRCRDALFLVDADHAAGLRGDVERCCFEDHLPAHQTQQLALIVAYRVDRIMAAEHELHRFRYGYAGLEHKHIAEHDVGEPRPVSYTHLTLPTNREV